MKKVVLLLMLFIGLKVSGQTFPPKPSIVGYIDQVIKNNPQVLIRGNVMNRILKEVLNYPVDTIWIVNDTLKYRQNGLVFNRLLSQGNEGTTLALKNIGQGVRMASLNPTADTFSFKRLVGDSTMAVTVMSDSTVRLSANTRHPNIQFQDEGIDLGDSGTVINLNFTGSGVTASRSGRTVDVVVTGGGGSGGGGPGDGNNFPTSVNVSNGTLTINRDSLSPISTPITTADITELGNLYYTPSRARSVISALAPLIYNSSTGGMSLDTSIVATNSDVNSIKVKSLLFDSTTKILTLTLNDDSVYTDTLKVTGDGNNFSTGVTVLGGTLSITRSGLSTLSTSISTADITESTNLFYTNARARSAILPVSPLIYNSATGNLSLDTTVRVATKFDINQVKPRSLVFDSVNRIVRLTLNDNSIYSDTLQISGSDQWGSQFVIRDSTLLGQGLLVSPLSVDTNRIATRSHLNYKIDSLTAGLDTLMFYRIEGIDSIYLQLNNQIISVLDSTSNIEFFDEGSSIGNTSKVSFVGSGVTAVKIGDVTQVSIPGGSGGGSDGNNYPLSIDTDLSGVMTIERFGITPIRDTLSTSNIPEGGRLYYTDQRSRNSISAQAPILYNSLTGTLSIDTLFISTRGIVQKKIDSLAARRDSSIYNSNGILTGNRLVNLDNFTLRFFNSPFISVENVRIGTGSGGYSNTITGDNSLAANTTGHELAAFGSLTLQNNTTGYLNSAFGSQALKSNTTGYRNTAVGGTALAALTTGYTNTALGESAISSLVDGRDNTGIGCYTFPGLTSGIGNTGVGSHTGFLLGGSYNNFFGVLSGDVGPWSGDYNIFIGRHYLSKSDGTSITGTVNNNTVIGSRFTGLPDNLSDNIIIGDGAGNQRIRVFSTGNTVIAYASPVDAGFKLDVNGTVRAAGALTLSAVPTQDDALTQILVRDPVTGEIKSRQASTLIGSGGSGTLIDSTTANNGLVMEDKNIKLGGSLIENTTLTAGSFSFQMTSVHTGFANSLTQNGTGSGFRSVVNNTSGQGYFSNTMGGYAYQGIVNSASNNTILPVASLIRQTSQTALPGMGGRIELGLEDNAGNVFNGAEIDVIGTDFTPASRKTRLEFRTMNTLSSTKFYISPEGYIGINQQPQRDDTLTMVMVRNRTDGELKWRDASTFLGFGTVTSVTLNVGSSGSNISVSNPTVTSNGTITLNVPDASETARGVVNTGTQSIAGSKTFTGNLTVTTLSGTGNRMVVANALGVLSTQPIPSGGGGTTETASNGLTKLINDIQLGGTLTQNTTINQGSFEMTFLGNVAGGSSSGVVNIRNNASGLGLLVDNSNAGGQTAIRTYTNGGIGIRSDAGNNGVAFYGESSGLLGLGGAFYSTVSNATAVKDVILVGRNTDVAINGLGAAVAYGVPTTTSGGESSIMARTQVIATNATSGSVSSEYQTQLMHNGGQFVRSVLKSTGQFQLNRYGSGLLTGTPTYGLGVDALGNLIETPVSTVTPVMVDEAPIAFAFNYDYASDVAGGQIKYVQKLGKGSAITNGEQVITLNAVMYVNTPNLVQGTWVKVATVPEFYRSLNTIYWSLPLRIDATPFYNSANTVQMTGNCIYDNAQARLKPNGDLEVNITVLTSASLSGNPVVVIPLNMTYFYYVPF